jgi:DNA polymerase-3 subunit chi
LASGAPTLTQRVEFHLLPAADERVRYRHACRLAEQAYLAGERVLVSLDSVAQLQAFDEMLWTFADRSFVPHEAYRDEQQWEQTPVLLGCDPQPRQAFDVLLNLANDVPVAASLARRVSEIIDADEPRRRAGRVRFRQYRDAGLTPETHNIPADQAT